MPLFPRREKPPSTSIRDVANYSEALHFLSDWIGADFEIAESSSVTEIYGYRLFEAAVDEQRVTILLPSVVNADAYLRNIEQLPLDSLDVGFSPDCKGGKVVGHSKTCVSRAYIDGFVACMNQIYGIFWTNLQVWVHRSKLFPMILVSEPLTFLIAPCMSKQVAWETGKKYYPESKPTLEKI